MTGEFAPPEEPEDSSPFDWQTVLTDLDGESSDGSVSREAVLAATETINALLHWLLTGGRKQAGGAWELRNVLRGLRATSEVGRRVVILIHSIRPDMLAGLSIKELSRLQQIDKNVFSANRRHLVRRFPFLNSIGMSNTKSRRERLKHRTSSFT